MRFPSFLSFAGLLALSSVAAAQSVTLLPGAVPRGLSRDGQAVTGWFNNSPFLWTPGAGFVALTGSVYDPKAVADLGSHVVGMMDDPVTGKQSSGYWTAATGQWLSLGPYQGNIGCPGYGEALTVSSDGSVIGGELFIGCNLNGYVWDQATGYSVMPKTGGFASVECVSGDGVLAGGWDTHPTQGYRRAALWSAAHVEAFPLVSAANPNGAGEINVFNSDGSIYGGLDDGGGGTFIFRDGVIVHLDVPQNLSRPTGLSDDGSVVVGSYGNFGVGYGAWVWNECDGGSLAKDFFQSQGVVFPPGLVLERMFGVSRDGRTFLAQYKGAGTGAAYIELPADWQATTYCTAKTNSQGCVPSICAAGYASLSLQAPYPVVLHDALNNKFGLLFYGLNGPASFPFGGGTMCVASPIRRTSVQSSGGNPPPDDCTGSYAFDFNAYAQSGADAGLVAGVSVFAQYWSRDPAHLDGTGQGLSDAVTFQLHP